ncbi:hypothetical protein POM88_008768 [Heracleum sosnowskyi]|uniref:Uncharacterized protein n=1 Tax=Heracleum sosnowskyi TaxID=360622 RepID=A0AAD8JAF8_9APIA|nr:hypothetical protein POM88_008768 [Heracleum sosnowskyi]
MPSEHSPIQVVGITNSGPYLEAATNVIPFPSPARFVFIKDSGFSTPNYCGHTYGEDYRATLYSLRFASTEARASLIVRFNYFSNPEDVEKCVNGAHKILRSSSMVDFRFQE